MALLSGVATREEWYYQNNYQDTRLCVSGQERHKTHSVLFTGSEKFLISTPCFSGTTQWIFIKFTYFMLYIYVTLHIKFERNQVSGEQDIRFQKLPNFLYIFLHLLLLHTAFEEFLNHIKITFPWFDFFYIWHIYKAH